jgi:hypothetical protein
VAPSQRLRQRQAEDGQVDVMGYVGPCYPCFTVFFLLDPRVLGLIVTSQFHFRIFRVEVSHKPFLVFVSIKCGREGGDKL